MPASVATAIRAPALNAVHAAPGAVVDNFHEVVRRVLLQELTVIRELRELIAFNVMQSVGERHLTEAMMMTIALAISGNVHELRPGARVRKAAHQAIGEALAIVEQALERHALRNGPIVEECRNRFARRQLNQICAARIDAIAGDVVPGTRFAFADTAG